MQDMATTARTKGVSNQEQYVSTDLQMDRSGLAVYLERLEVFLKDNFPECVLMPTKSNMIDSSKAAEGKNPAYKHRNKSASE